MGFEAYLIPSPSLTCLTSGKLLKLSDCGLFCMQEKSALSWRVLIRIKWDNKRCRAPEETWCSEGVLTHLQVLNECGTFNPAPRLISLNMCRGPQECMSRTARLTLIQPMQSTSWSSRAGGLEPRWFDHVILAQALNLSEPQFPHLYIDGNHIRYFLELLVDKAHSRTSLYFKQ